MARTFEEIFKRQKPVIGMLHLAGDSSEEIARRAVLEVRLFCEHGFDGAIIENYHGGILDVERVLNRLSIDLSLSLVLGVNILPNDYKTALRLASDPPCRFIQLDQVAGSYVEGNINPEWYQTSRERYPQPAVFGGVHPKYYTPIDPSLLSDDIDAAVERCEAIVVTGAGTGKETPLEKIVRFKELIAGRRPLIVGAGTTPENVGEQLCYADGVIIGSALKPGGKTHLPADPVLVQEYMTAVGEARRRAYNST